MSDEQHPRSRICTNLPIGKGNDADYSTDHITTGSAKTPHKIPAKDTREPSPIMYRDVPAL